MGYGAYGIVIIVQFDQLNTFVATWTRTLEPVGAYSKRLKPCDPQGGELIPSDNKAKLAAICELLLTTIHVEGKFVMTGVALSPVIPEEGDQSKKTYLPPAFAVSSALSA